MGQHQTNEGNVVPNCRGPFAMFGKISIPISLYYNPPLFLLFYVKVQKRIKIPGKITKIIPILLFYDPFFIVLILQQHPPHPPPPHHHPSSLLIIPPLPLGTSEYETKCIKIIFALLKLLAI